MNNKFTKEELLQIRAELASYDDPKYNIDYHKYRRSEKKLRTVNIRRAQKLALGKITRRLKHMLYLFRDELEAYAKRPKILDEHGKLIFLDEKGEKL